VAMSLLLVWRHEGNIRKLLKGTESRLGSKPAAAAAAKSAKSASAAPAVSGSSKAERQRKGHS